MNQILLINGPNLNLLGSREPKVYGADTLAAIEADLQQQAKQLALQLSCFQANGEEPIVERIQQAGRDGVDFILLNPAAFTHTSVAMRDALAAVAIPFIELHLSNPHAREPFRSHSYFTDLAQGVIAGFGAHSYTLALEAAGRILKRQSQI